MFNIFSKGKYTTFQMKSNYFIAFFMHRDIQKHLYRHKMNISYLYTQINFIHKNQRTYCDYRSISTNGKAQISLKHRLCFIKYNLYFNKLNLYFIKFKFNFKNGYGWDVVVETM